jgi:hypothetical protein
VYVPRRFRAAATQLSDRAVLEKDVRPTMLPFSLSKSDPMIFYDQMARHHQFLDEHKNIQIQDVPMDNFDFSKESIDGGDSATLRQILNSNKKILRVYRYEDAEKLNLSVHTSDYFSVTKWLDRILSQFQAYRPKRVYGRPVVRFALDTGSVQSDQKSKYSSKFKASSAST